MKILFFILFFIGLQANDATISRVYDTPGHYFTVDVEHVDMKPWQLQEWNQIQQDQIDDLLGRTNDLTHNYLLLKADMYNLAEYTTYSQAGDMAVANIDFGNIAEGHFSIGFGFGYGEPVNGFQGKAGAFGIKGNFGKYNIMNSDVTINGTAKGWSSGNHGSAGFGFTLDF